MRWVKLALAVQGVHGSGPRQSETGGKQAAVGDEPGAAPAQIFGDAGTIGDDGDREARGDAGHRRDGGGFGESALGSPPGRKHRDDARRVAGGEFGGGGDEEAAERDHEHRRRDRRQTGEAAEAGRRRQARSGDCGGASVMPAWPGIGARIMRALRQDLSE